MESVEDLMGSFEKQFGKLYSAVNTTENETLKIQLDSFFETFKQTLTEFEWTSSAEKSREEPNDFE